MAKGDYTLVWVNFDTDEGDEIYSSHITTIQDNIDLIKESLANISHDSSVLSADYIEDYSDKNITIKSGHMDDVKTDYYNDHRDSIKTTYLTDHLTSHKSSEDTSALMSHHLDDYSAKEISADISNLANRCVSYYASVDNSDKESADDSENVSIKGGHNSYIRSGYCYPGRCRSYYLAVYDNGG